MAGLAMSSLVGGLSEAGLLVVVTRAAFAITSGDRRVELVADHRVTVGEATAIALGLVVLRVALAVLSNQQAASLSSAVVATTRSQLATSFLNASWSVQSADRTGQLQELLTTFTVQGNLLITSILNAGQGAIERYYSRGDRGAQTAARKKSPVTNWEAENDRA